MHLLGRAKTPYLIEIVQKRPIQIGHICPRERAEMPYVIKIYKINNLMIDG